MFSIIIDDISVITDETYINCCETMEKGAHILCKYIHKVVH